MPSDQRPMARERSDRPANRGIAACFLVLACGAAGLTAGLGWHRVVPPHYQAEARLVLDAGSYADAGIDDLAALRARLARATGEAALHAAGVAAQDVSLISPSGELTASLQVRSTTAEAAARGANVVAETFAQGEAAYLAARQDAALAAAQRRIAAYVDRLAALRDEGQAPARSAAPSRQTAKPSQPDPRIAALTAERDALARAVGSDKADLSALPPALATLGARRDEAAAELNLLSRTYGPRHPRRIEAARRLDAARAAFVQEGRRLIAASEASLDAARQEAEARPVSPPQAEPALAPAAPSPAVAALEAELAGAQASLAALAAGPRRAPVDIVSRALPPMAPVGPGPLARAILGAAAGIVLALALLCVLAVARLLRRPQQSAPTILSDVPYHAVDLGAGQAPMRLVSPSAAVAPAASAQEDEPQGEPVAEAPLPVPAETPVAQEPPPEDKDEVAQADDMARSVQDLAEAVRQAQAALPTRPRDAASTLAPDGPEPDTAQTVLGRRDRLRQELRDMAARRLADGAGEQGGARILTPEELRQRHDARSAPTRLS